MPRMGNKNLQRLIGLLALTALAHPAFCDGEHIEDARQEQQKPTLNPEQCKEGDAYTKESIARGLECHSYFLETLARELKERAESGKPLGSKTDLSKETLTIDVLQDLLLKNGFSLDEANDLIKNIQTFESNYSRIQQDDPEKESKEAEQEKTIKNIFNQIADRIEKKRGR